MLTKQSKFILAVMVQILIIGFIIIFKLTILGGGTEVLLKIEPVDPRDMLRGDYVTFQYTNVSSISPYVLLQERQIKNGDTVYVVLWKRGKYWVVKNVKKTKPLNGEIALKGKIVSGRLSIDQLKQRANIPDIRVTYGIEEYFIPEGVGQNFSFSNKEAFAKVVIDEKGNAVLKEIFVDGKPWP